MGDYPKIDTHLQCDLEAIYDVFTVLKTTDMDQGAENERNVQQVKVSVLRFKKQGPTRHRLMAHPVVLRYLS